MGRQSSTNRTLPPPSHPSQPSPIHPSIWHSCAGNSVQTPTVNSTVYYFIQGHLDQASSTPQYISPHVYSTPFVLARIVDVQFLADPITDEVFTKLVLHPITHRSVSPPPVSTGERSNSFGDEKFDVVFSKILTRSNANNGKGLSVPRFCAESIFPPLNLLVDTPFQNLRITDVHRNVWEVCHIYRGTPRRHFLTTGWSKFVDFKNLVAGDSVFFTKNSKGEIIVGVRRSKRPRDSCSGESSTDLSAVMLGIGGVRIRDEDEEEEEEGFSRNGNLAPEKVVEAAELAVQGKPFEVVYYPSAGWSDFVVKAKIVDEARKVTWSPGMRVKMAVEIENSCMMSWIKGTVSAVCVPENGQWCGSPWKMLQVAWDEPEGLQNPKFVSPWQVKLESATPAIWTTFTPTKRFRAAHGSLVLTDGEGDSNSSDGEGDSNSSDGEGDSNSRTGQLNGTVGMQGARHDLFSPLNFYSFFGDMPHPCLANFFGNNSAPNFNSLFTELNFGSLQRANLPPDSQGSLNSFGIEFLGTHRCNSTKAGSGSTQVFGATIEAKQPNGSVLHLPSCTKLDSCKGCNEIKAMDTLECSLGYSEWLNMLDDLDDGECIL